MMIPPWRGDSTAKQSQGLSGAGPTSHHQERGGP